MQKNNGNQVIIQSQVKLKKKKEISRTTLILAGINSIRKQADRERERETVPKMIIADGHMTAAAFPPLKDIEKAMFYTTQNWGSSHLKSGYRVFKSDYDLNHVAPWEL